MVTNATLEVIFWSDTNARTLLPAVVAMGLFSLWMRKVLLHKTAPVKNIPFLVLTVILLVLEFIKQGIEISHGYEGYYAIPLHFSSLFLFLYPLAHFTHGRFSEAMKGIAGVASGMSALFLILFPMDVIGNSAEGFFTSFAAFHTVFYHYALVLYFFLFVLLEIHVPDPKKDLKRLLITITAYTAVAAPISNLLKTNYNSFYTCGFEPAEIVRQQLAASWGLFPTQLLYTFIMYSAILFFGILLSKAYVAMAKGLIWWSAKPRSLPHLHWRPEVIKKFIISGSFDPCRIDPAYELSPCYFFSSRFIKL